MVLKSAVVDPPLDPITHEPLSPFNEGDLM